ncbi:MAG: type II toxin-antitoxin system HicB family antitoxin [Pseudomonadota bacterium]
MATYVGIVHKDKGSDYGVSFPDFPGCVSAGSTPDELQDMAQEALGLHIEGMVEDGEAVSKPMGLAQVKKLASTKDAVAFIFVRAAVPGKPQRVNVVLDSNLIADIDRVASNRSAFLAEAARHELQRRSV